MKAIVTAMTCLLGSGIALSHSKMAESVPAEDATTKVGLTEVIIGFSQPIRLMLVQMRNTASKIGSGGKILASCKVWHIVSEPAIGRLLVCAR